MRGLTLRRTASVMDAVRGADIVTTATASKSHACIVTPAMLEPGMHLNAVGGDCPGKTELHPDVLRRARIVVEYAPQTRIEGEVQQLPADYTVTELWQVLAGQAAGREHEGQVTLFDSVGFALEDHATLRLIHRLAEAHHLGIYLELVPGQGDPKDFFCRVRTSGQQSPTPS